ncbi:MAG: prepilin-type N-terminal cleavage/methylation domain-containing protein [Polyangiaceae bacterium]|nr:prepilin-type N-terminal cleavage/methylation domain-containing protein [Polyangiaceae bacterium]
MTSSTSPRGIRRRARRGFTLLEVLVAISILGLGLTVILSSQVGLFSSSQRAQSLTLAGTLARCKMSETELELLTKGFPLIDQRDDGVCCEGEERGRFSCRWTVQTVKLPEPQDLATMSGDGGLGDPGGLGALGALASVQQGGPSALPGEGGLAGLAGLMGSAAGAGTQGMAPMLMSMVYPDLKPMLEASIRKVTVTVVWKEGSREQTLDVTQYVTNPQQGGLSSAAAQGLDKLEGVE